MYAIRVTKRDGQALYLPPYGTNWTPDRKKAGRWERAKAFAKAMTLDASRQFPAARFDGGPELVPVS